MSFHTYTFFQSKILEGKSHATVSVVHVVFSRLL